jgi:signal transduction histidine kinase/ActR/RegA family two-component response regulator
MSLVPIDAAASMSAGAPDFPAQARAVAADRYVQATIATFVALLAIFVSPALDASTRLIATPALNATFLAVAAAACLIDLRRVEDPFERQFWVRFAAALGLWSLIETLHALAPGPVHTVGGNALTDTLLLLCYAFLLAGIDSFAAAQTFGTLRGVSRMVRPAVFLTTTLGWLAYLVVVPLATSTSSPTADWHARVVLDLAVVGALLGADRQNRTHRWMTLRHWLLAALTLAAAVHLLGGVFVGQHLDLRTTGLSPLLWVTPHVGFVLAARLRRHLPHDALIAPRTSERSLVIADGTFLVLAAFSLPVAHMLNVVAGRAPADVQSGQGLVVALVTLVVGVLAAVEYRSMEVERTRLARERAGLELAVLQMQKMEAIGRLGGGIAHDFNNLLTAIGGYADIVLEGLPESDPTAYAMQQVRAAVDRASALTGQLLVVGRRQHLNLESTDVNEIIRDLPHAHRYLLAERTELRPALASDLALAWVDPSQVEQVILNLVVNARDAMPDGGAIRISTSNVVLGDGAPAGWPESKPGRYVRMDIADSGTGIPDDVLPQIFEPFFTTKPAGSGTGLGLSVVYGIIRQSGGRVSVSSTVGRGTTVTIDLPAAAPRTAGRAATGPAPAETGTETVLVAEDEQAVRELVRSMLVMGGYRVIVAASGEEALTVADRYDGPIHLLLSDVVMPGINGRELAERLVKRRPTIRTMFMTGYTDDAVVRHGVRGGAVTLVPKPFTRQDLLAAVRRVLDSPLQDRADVSTTGGV